MRINGISHGDGSTEVSRTRRRMAQLSQKSSRLSGKTSELFGQKAGKTIVNRES